MRLSQCNLSLLCKHLIDAVGLGLKKGCWENLNQKTSANTYKSGRKFAVSLETTKEMGPRRTEGKKKTVALWL